MSREWVHSWRAAKVAGVTSTGAHQVLERASDSNVLAGHLRVWPTGGLARVTGCLTRRACSPSSGPGERSYKYHAAPGSSVLSSGDQQPCWPRMEEQAWRVLQGKGTSLGGGMVPTCVPIGFPVLLQENGKASGLWVSGRSSALR